MVITLCFVTHIKPQEAEKIPEKVSLSLFVPLWFHLGEMHFAQFLKIKQNFFLTGGCLCITQFPGSAGIIPLNPRTMDACIISTKTRQSCLG